MFREILEEYLRLFPEDEVKLKMLSEQIASGHPLDRSNPAGHITGSAIIFSPDKKKVLLVHHKFLDFWLQPGGHWETDESGPWLTAKRETAEETGIALAEALDIEKSDPRIPAYIGTHLIPSNPAKSEGAHYHHDFKYGFIAADTKVALDPLEVRDSIWCDIDDDRTEHIKGAIARLKPLLKA